MGQKESNLFLTMASGPVEQWGLHTPANYSPQPLTLIFASAVPSRQVFQVHRPSLGMLLPPRNPSDCFSFITAQLSCQIQSFQCVFERPLLRAVPMSEGVCLFFKQFYDPRLLETSRINEDICQRCPQTSEPADMSWGSLASNRSTRPGCFLFLIPVKVSSK